MLLNPVPPVCLRLLFNDEKEILRYTSRKAYDLITCIWRLRGDRRRRSEEVEEMRTRRKDRTMVAPSVPFSECEILSRYSPSVGSAGKCVQKVVNYDTGKQEWSSVSPMSEPV